MSSNNSSNDENNARAVPVQPRQPTNIQGLLRFAMEATKSEDAPANSNMRPMTEENRLFLAEVIKSFTVDPTETLQQAIQTLTDSEKIKGIQPGHPLPADVKVAFDNLLECVIDVDVANDFHKLGGFAVFPILYASDNDEVRASASSLLAELCQNNPYCQERALEAGLMNVLLDLLQSETGVALAKCIYAISCASREDAPACCALMEGGGCQVLAHVLRDTPAANTAARTKAAFLIRYLCLHYAEAKEMFLEQNIVSTLVEQIDQGRDAASEHLLSTLLALVENRDPALMAQCRDPTANLKQTLEAHLAHPDLAGDTCKEEKQYCQEILNIVFQNCTQTEGANKGIDR